MESKSLQCPKCGGTMEYNEDKTLLKCPYCEYAEKADKTEEAYAIAYATVSASQKAKADLEKKQGITRRFKGVVIAIIVICAFAAIGGLAELLKDAYNPFESAVVTFYGKDGEGKCSVKIDDEHSAYVTFEMPDEYLKEGQVIEIKARSEEYRLTERKKKYTVNGLDKRITSKEQITEKVAEYIHSQSLRLQETSNKYNAKISYTPLNFYIVSEENEAFLFDVWKLTITKDKYSRDYIWAVRYDNVFESSGISPAEYSRSEKIGYMVSIILNKEKDNGDVISVLDSSYCGAFTGYRDITSFENAIHSDYATAKSIEKVELN